LFRSRIPNEIGEVLRSNLYHLLQNNFIGRIDLHNRKR